jgi:hypothetical protein
MPLMGGVCVRTIHCTLHETKLAPLAASPDIVASTSLSSVGIVKSILARFYVDVQIPMLRKPMNGWLTCISGPHRFRRLRREAKLSTDAMQTEIRANHNHSLGYTKRKEPNQGGYSTIHAGRVRPRDRETSLALIVSTRKIAVLPPANS